MENARSSHHLRHRVNSDKPLRVSIQRENESQSAPGGELLDISAAGARLSLVSPLRFDECFQLMLKSPEVGLDTSVACRVQWIRAGQSETEWTLGCRFDTELNAKVLDDLVEKSILERRDSYRQDVSIPVHVAWEGAEVEELSELRNISSGGFCLVAPPDIGIGAPVRIRLNRAEGGHCLAGRATWKSTSDNETVVGCKWQDRQGAEWFHKRTAAQARCGAKISHAKQRLQRSRLTSRAAVPLLAFFLGLQIGAYQAEIAEWVQSRAQELQQIVVSYNR